MYWKPFLYVYSHKGMVRIHALPQAVTVRAILGQPATVTPTVVAFGTQFGCYLLSCCVFLFMYH